jgi:hypothetical protein
MKKGILILLMLFPVHSFSQKKITERPYTQNCTLQPDYLIRESARFGLPYLVTDTVYDAYYRLRTYNQIINVWKKDSVYEGSIISYVYIVDAENGIIERKTKSCKHSICGKIAKQAFEKLTALDSIHPGLHKAYKNYLFDVPFTLEYSTPFFFSERCFTPMVGFETAFICSPVDLVLQFLFVNCKIYSCYDFLINSLPDGEYTNAGNDCSIVKKGNKIRNRNRIRIRQRICFPYKGYKEDDL